MSSSQTPRTSSPTNDQRRSYSEVASTPPRGRSHSPSAGVVSPGKVLETIASSGGINESIHSPNPFPKQIAPINAGNKLTPLTVVNDGPSGTSGKNSGTNDNNNATHSTNKETLDAVSAIANPMLPTSVATAINVAADAATLSVDPTETTDSATAQPRRSARTLTKTITQATESR